MYEKVGVAHVDVKVGAAVAAGDFVPFGGPWGMPVGAWGCPSVYSLTAAVVVTLRASGCPSVYSDTGTVAGHEYDVVVQGTVVVRSTMLVTVTARLIA